MKKTLFIFTALLFTSCSSYMKPPKKPLKTLFSKKDLKENEKLALKLYRLSIDTNPRCEDLGSMSQDKKNPLKYWTISEYFKRCNTSQDFLASEFEERETYPKWARQDLNEAIFQSSTNPSHQVIAGLDLVKYQKTPQQKVDILNKALAIAKKNNLPTDAVLSLRIEVAPRFNTTVTKENIFKVARDFEKNREFDSARKLYKEMITKDEYLLEDKIKAWDRIRYSYKLQRDRKTYVKETAKLVKFLSKKIDSQLGTEKYSEYSIILSRVLWTKGLYSRAKKVLRDLLAMKSLPSKYKVDIYYHMAGIYEDQRKNRKSIAYYIKAYNSINPEKVHKLEEKVLWNICWFFYKRKNYKKAASWLAKYQPEDDYENFRFKFWLAKTYEKLRDKKAAAKLYNYIAKNDQYGYYGQISHMDRKELSKVNYVKPSLPSKKDALSWALYTSNYKLAQKIIDAKDLSAFDTYYSAKYFDKLIFKYFALEKDDKESIVKKHLIYPYPLAYKTEFIKYNLSSKVSAPLLMAIARQESAFNTFARSPADAFGLLQLIPSQAKKLSKRYNIKFGNFNDLYTPKTNIALSSKLLEELMRRQRGNFIHFVASYNAGETAVRRWKRNYRKFSDLEFVEQIPYEETRKYVKLVTRNYLVYKRLLHQSNFVINSDFFSKGSY